MFFGSDKATDHAAVSLILEFGVRNSFRTPNSLDKGLRIRFYCKAVSTWV